MNKLRQWWRAFRNLDAAQRERDMVLTLVDERARFQDQLHLIQLEVNDLQERLKAERSDHAKTKGHVEKLWLFISRRARVDTPAANGTIRKILQEIESR